MTNFDTAREALDASLNSSGSAMREHAKWSESLEARLNKLKSTWQSLSQTFMGSDFLKGVLDVVIGLINGLDKLIDSIGVLGASFVGLGIWKIFSTAKTMGGLKSLKSLTRILEVLNSAFPRTSGVIARFTSALAGTGSIVEALKAGLSGLWSVMMAHPILAVIAAVGVGIAIFNKFNESASELAERIDELTSKYKDQHKALKDISGDYDTTNADSMVSKYRKLSKGVDDLGRNVSLTADEYSEYQGIVNKIAEQIPSLVSGYDSQGNALLSCKDNVEELVTAYEKLIHAQNQEILTNAGDIEKNFENIYKDKKSSVWDISDMSSSTAEKLEDIYNGDYSSKEIQEILLEGAGGENRQWQIAKVLEDAGIDISWTGYSWASDEVAKALEEVMKTDPSKVKGIIDNFYNQFSEVIEQKKTIASAKLSEAFDISSSISGLNYSNISEELQQIAYQTVNNLDWDFFTKLQENGQTVEQWITNVLNQLKTLSKDDSAKIETSFNLSTQFNNGDIPYGDYIQGVKSASDLANRLVSEGKLDSEIANQIKLTLDTDEVIANYDALKERLTSNKYNIKMNAEEAEKFLGELTASEHQVYVDLIANEDMDFSQFDINSLRAYIEKEARLLDAMNFTIAIDVETESIEALNGALAESVSGAGLSANSIEALKSRYSELESQGYDLSLMFEETATGIHLNREAVDELEQKLASNKLAETDKQLDVLKGRYDELTEEIDNCTDASKRASLYTEQQSIVDKINDLGTLASQYKGLTSAYNDWIKAEEAGSERDMYEKVIEGFGTVKDEISRGWVDDGTIKFLELLTGKTGLAGKSGKELKEIYDSLDDTIKNTTYSISDFFTVDEDGNSTNTGVYNFLDAIGQLEEEAFGGKDVVKRDKDGNIISFDFELAGGDEAIAKALGVSEEIVQIMLRAADDAGFVVTLEGNWTQFADLKNQADQANDSLKKIAQTNDSLKKAGFGEYDFNFGASSIEELDKELEKAKELLDNDAFKKDGKFNINAEGAKDALKIAETLQIAKNKLEEPSYMSVDTSKLEKDLQKPVEYLQEYERLTQERDLLNLTGEDKERLDEIDIGLNEIAIHLSQLDEETKIKLGIDGKTPEQIREELENGKIEIPTELTIEANMDKSLEDLVTLGLLEQGLISEKAAKIRLGIEVDNVDTSAIEEAIDEVEVSEETEVVIKAFAEVFGIENVEDLVYSLGELDNKTIQAIAEVFGKIDVESLNNAVDLLDDETIKVIAEALGEGDVTGLKNTISSLDDKTVKTIARAFGYDDVNDLYGAIEDLDSKTVEAIAEVLGITDVDSLKGAVDRLTNKNIDVVANTSGETEVNNLKSAIDKIKDKTVTITTKVKRFFSNIFGGGDDEGGSDVNGTAHANGTTGRAFKQGDWRTKKTETALTGELGQELVVTGNRWYTVGDHGAEFVKIPKNSIVFNHRQTEELFKNGKVTSDGGRGKAYASGTAFAPGSSSTEEGIGRVEIKTNTVDVTSKETKTSDNSSKTSGSTGSGGGNKADGKSAMSAAKEKTEKTEKDEKEFEETFDAIEIAISRIEREMNNLDQLTNRTYTSWSSRNRNLEKELTAIDEAIDLQNRAYRKYMAEAMSVDLSNEWKQRVRDGSIAIYDESNYDEDTGKKIQEYKTWYEKALACQDAILDLKDTEAELYRQNFDNVVSRYDGKLDVIENAKSIMEQYIEQSRYTTNISGSNNDIYNRLINQEQNTINQLTAKKIELEQALSKAITNGLSTNSEDYQEMRNEIDAITLAIEESMTSIYQHRRSMFDEVSDKYDTILQSYEHAESMLNEYISQAEARGQIVSKNYYQALINNEKASISQLKKEQSALISARDNAVKSGDIAKYSQEWYEMSNEIDGVTREIEEGATALIEYSNAMRDIDWEIFDLVQQRISDVTDEANFLIELMSNEKLFDDKGKLTNQGLATMGLRAQNYNTHMYQADNYGEEIAKIDAQLAKGYDRNLEERRRELIDLQRESILAAEDEKNAIRDLVEESIELELDALDELIEKKNESLQSEKDLYEYQKKVKEQTEEIASLEKQMAAYRGDDSEETKAKIQELKISLEEAKADLEETEYDKYISDQQKLLDSLYIEAETLLNSRLDNVDALINDVITMINTGSEATNSTLSALLGTEGTLATSLGAEGEIAKGIGANAALIKSTLTTEANNVGVKLSSAMNNIWSTGEGSAKSVLTMYGEDFRNKSTTINSTLSSIKIGVDNLVNKSNKDAAQKVSQGKTQSSSKVNPVTNIPVSSIVNNTEKPKTPITNKTSSSGDGKAKVGDRVKFVSGQYYYDSQGKQPLGYHNRGGYVYITKISTANWSTHPYHISTGKKLGTGDLGWLKLNQLSGYATGKKNFANNEWAWTQEKGEEYIIRPSDGAILTPIARRGSVLNAEASNNLWNMANSPAEFIRDNLKLDASNVPNGSNVQNSYMQNLDKVVFNFPNVKSYDEMLKQMQNDKSFEKLITAMTINRIAGGSSLAKGKSIR